MKVAIVHDFLNQFGGAERVVWAMHELFPEAPIYTSIFEPKNLPEPFRKLQVISSSVQKMPFVSRFTKAYTFFYPVIFENFDLSEYDIVLSSSASFAKGVLVKPQTLHICYCHTPPRFLYHYHTEMDRRKIKFLAPVLSLVDNYLRIWDFNAAQRVDHFLTNSKHTAARIKKFYRREATVIYPPVDIKPASQPAKNEGYYLVVSRLAQYKNIDLAIEAANLLHFSLKIVGTGREEKRLKKIAGKTVEFIGWGEEDKLAEYYLNCQAFLFPGEDDFGITPVEAMGYGKPVIALGKGGVLESVIPGKTGEFFSENTVESLSQVINNFDPRRYDPQDCIKQARQFSPERFKDQLADYINRVWTEFKQDRT